MEKHEDHDESTNEHEKFLRLAIEVRRTLRSRKTNENDSFFSWPKKMSRRNWADRLVVRERKKTLFF